jgi:xylulokinase
MNRSGMSPPADVRLGRVTEVRNEMSQPVKYRFDAAARGAILGLRLTTGRGEIIRALLEGVTFEMRLNIDILARSGVEIDALVASGGGARSAAWTQIKADVMGKPIATTSVSETGCLGAAMLARAAVTGASAADLVGEMTRTSESVEPDPARARYYEERFEVYRELYPALRGIGA